MSPPQSAADADRSFDVERAFAFELVPRRCQLRPYRRIRVPSYRVAGEFITYASPDSTYAVTASLLETATESIVIGIYDFTADYIADALLAAVRRGVKVSVMLDLDNRKGEPRLWDRLIRQGCEGIPAPSCASRRARYFPSCHEKVVVIDRTWTLVQSGNYSSASIPRNERDGADRDRFVWGNRDMGVAVKSRPLAAFFTRLLRGDMKLELEGPDNFPPGQPAPGQPVARPGPPQPPPTLFPSRTWTFPRPVEVTPIISPENYMRRIRPWLASARSCIYVEQQYIRTRQGQVRTLLSAIRSAMDRQPDLDVRIVLAPPFAGSPDDLQDLRELADFGLEFGRHVRLLNPRYFTHCHNKMIVVDKQAVLVSSQNWSDSAVARNREAGLLLRQSDLAGYYAEIFAMDWDHGVSRFPEDRRPPARDGAGPSASTAAVIVDPGDYVEV